jgi:hypothetical protein|tara:strand:+ start:2142 stop:2507 length:366 start_codon:yes stop_codon:yes gene_type:complete
MSLSHELNRCRPWIEAALEYSGGTHLYQDIVEGIASGHMQFWPAPKGCAVTEIIIFPRKKVFHIFLAGGEKNQIVDMDDSAMAFAKAQGCSGMTIAGRKGWSRVLKTKGWTEAFTTLSKDI